MNFREIYILGLDKKDLSLKDKSTEEWISILDEIEFSDSDKDENVVRIANAVIKAIKNTYNEIYLKYPVSKPTNYNIDILDSSSVPTYVCRGSIGLIYNRYPYGMRYVDYISISWLKYLIKNVDIFEQYMKDTYIQNANKEIEKLKTNIEKIKETL